VGVLERIVPARREAAPPRNTAAEDVDTTARASAGCGGATADGGASDFELAAGRYSELDDI